jgi:hypothetical protein
MASVIKESIARRLFAPDTVDFSLNGERVQAGQGKGARLPKPPKW